MPNSGVIIPTFTCMATTTTGFSAEHVSIQRLQEFLLMNKSWAFLHSSSNSCKDWRHCSVHHNWFLLIGSSLSKSRREVRGRAFFSFANNKEKLPLRIMETCIYKQAHDHDQQQSMRLEPTAPRQARVNGELETKLENSSGLQKLFLSTNCNPSNSNLLSNQSQ